MVQFEDGAVLAQLGLPDMKLPIAYALSYPKRLKTAAPRLDFRQYASLTFEEPEKVLESMEKSFEFMQPWLKAQEDFLNIVEPKDKTYTSFILQDEVVDAVLEILGEETIKGNLTAGDSKIHDETKKELYEKLEG